MGTSKPEVEVITTLGGDRNTLTTAPVTGMATVEHKGRENSDNAGDDFAYKSAQTTILEEDQL